MIVSGQNLRLREKSPRYLRLWVFKSSFDEFGFAKCSQNFKVKEKERSISAKDSQSIG